MSIPRLFSTQHDQVSRLFVQSLEYGKDIHVDLLLKHIDNSDRLYKAGVEKIDYHIPERFTREQLVAAIGNAMP